MPGIQDRIGGVWKSSLAQDSGWMVLGLGGNSLLQAASFLLLARLLGVIEYGIFAGAFALVNTVTPYSALGSQMIFMRHVSADRNMAQIYWGNMLAITAATSLLLATILGLAGSRLLGSTSVWLIVVLVIANSFLSQIANNASIVFQTFEKLKETAWLRAWVNILRLLAIAALLIGLRHATAFQCSLGILASSAIAACVAIVWVKNTIGKMHVNASLIRLRFWEGIGFSVAGSSTAIYNDVDKMMLSHYGMNAANGIYSMAYRIVDFATIPVNAIDTACLPRYFSLNKEGLPAISRLAMKTVPIGALSGLAMAGFTIAISPLIIHMVGSGFSEMVLALHWLCWLPAMRGIHQLAGGVLTASGRQNYRTVAQILVAVLNFGLNLIWIPAHGWLGAAWASLISDGALGVINLLLVVLVYTTAGSFTHADSHKEQPE